MRFGDEKKVNPVQFYLDYKSTEKKFQYYDKENQENIRFDLEDNPFVVLRISYTVKGYDRKKKTGIYSNAVESFGEEFTVKSFAWDEIAKGKWSDIKEKCESYGAKLHIAVMFLLDDGTVGEFFLKGKAYYELNQVIGKMNTNKYMVNLKWFQKEEWVSGDYYVPVFEKSDVISEDLIAKATQIVGQIEDEPEESKETNVEDDAKDEDFPF